MDLKENCFVCAMVNTLVGNEIPLFLTEKIEFEFDILHWPNISNGYDITFDSVDCPFINT